MQTPEVPENKTLSSAGQSLLSFDRSRIDEYKSFNISHSNRQGTPHLEKVVEKEKPKIQPPPATPYRYSEKEISVSENPPEKVDIPRRKFETPSRIRREEPLRSSEVELPPVRSSSHLLRESKVVPVIPPVPPSPPKPVIEQAAQPPAPIVTPPPAPETLQGMMGKKILDDLKNDKDWKIRSDAIEELQKKF